MKWLAIVFLLVVVAVPAVSAQFPPTQEEFFEGLYGKGQEGRVTIYPIYDVTNVGVGTFGATFQAFRLDTREVVQQNWVFIISATYTFDLDTAGSYDYQLDVDGVNIPDCRWVLQTWNSLAVGQDMKQTAKFALSCDFPAGSYGSHTFNVTRTVLSGTPDTVESAVTTVAILNLDAVKEPDVVALQFLGYTTAESNTILLLLVLFLLMMWQGWWMGAFGTGIGLLTVLYSGAMDADLLFSEFVTLISLGFVVLGLAIDLAISGFRSIRGGRGAGSNRA